MRTQSNENENECARHDEFISQKSNGRSMEKDSGADQTGWKNRFQLKYITYDASSLGFKNIFQ